MTGFDLPPLYAIVDPEQTKGRHSLTVLRWLLEAGARVIQLRAKAATPREFFQLAREARALADGHDCKLIVNDRADIALACGADGVHLGQDDLPLGAARKLMADKVIGISTHTLEQALEAERSGADYIGFGPIFATSTKDTGYATRGTEMLGALRAAIRIPIVAIGGITEENVGQVWRAGADSAAIIREILGADNVAAKARRILHAAQRAQEQ
jgi:thiamine-phosphate diphosphorylase